MLAAQPGVRWRVPAPAAKHAAERGVQRARCFSTSPPPTRSRRARGAAAANASCGVRASSYGYAGATMAGARAGDDGGAVGGPTAAFFVAAEFMVYSSGTYAEAEAQEDEYHAEARRDGYARAVAPWRKTSHSVLLVGWGESKGGERDGIGGGGGGPYWIARNSWGDDWGEDGYFRIRRGTDECGVESMAVTAEPEVPPLTAGAGLAWTVPARRQGRRPRRLARRGRAPLGRRCCLPPTARRPSPPPRRSRLAALTCRASRRSQPSRARRVRRASTLSTAPRLTSAHSTRRSRRTRSPPRAALGGIGPS